MTAEVQSPASKEAGLTAEEARLYDRQIRLWGVGAQERMRRARILLDGFSGVQSEICKNLVLAGINAVTLNDRKLCSPADLAANFFLDPNSVGKNRAEAAGDRVRHLNPHVRVSEFDICVFSNKTFAEYVEANKRCRDAGVNFMIAESFGYFGYTFEDLGDIFKYVRTRTDNRGQEEKKELMSTFIPLPRSMGAHWQKKSNVLSMVVKVLYEFALKNGRDATAADKPALLAIKAELLERFKLPATTLKDDFLVAVVDNLGTELSAVTSIVGGVGAQEVLKVICANEEPFTNFYLFNAFDGTGNVIHLFDPN